MTSDYLWRIAKQLMVASEQSLDPTITGIDLPGRRFIHHGQPVVEFCETGTLSVWHDSLNTRQIGRNDAPQIQISTFFFVDVWRCWPVGNNIAPSLEKIEDAVKILHVDAWCLLNGMQKRLQGLTGCEMIQYQEMRALVPLGGMAGWRLPIQIGLSGALPFLSK
jgi:hypothetical protein